MDMNLKLIEVIVRKYTWEEDEGYDECQELKDILTAIINHYTKDAVKAEALLNAWRIKARAEKKGEI